MVQIWRPGDNFCAFETLSKMANLKKNFALMKNANLFVTVLYMQKMEQQWLELLFLFYC
jgi:hypothetical protein